VTTGISLSTIGCRAPMLVEAARTAEEAGFDSVWCYDHLSGAVLGGDRCVDVWSTLGAVATATERVTVGPLVANVTTRDAVHLAVAAGSLQSLSEGRFHLGLGAGASAPSPFAVEMEMFHLRQESAERRRARVVETIGFLRALWDGVPRFDGHWASYSDVRGITVPVPLCPIIVGANGPKMAELAGRHADGVNFHSSEVGLQELVRIARQAADAEGRASFTASTEGPFEPEWLDAGSPTRDTLTAIGITDVVVSWRAELGLDAIRAAANFLP
jgi:alkanesulfonate monooxygenase SsuD/methylene tetrahydromethanopterin reductase-like flavin-dependent oxidoreductase (luciferase family)